VIGAGVVKVGLRDSTVKTYSNKLNAFFVWLIERKIIVNNPLEHIKLRYPYYTDQRVLEEGDVQKLYSVVLLHSGYNPLL